MLTLAALQGMNAVKLLYDGMFAEGYPPLPYSAYQIAPIIGATERVTERILTNLSRAGIITVKRGPGGGFRISEDQLKTKSVRDVLGALGQAICSPEGSRASDRLQQTLHDVLDVSLEEFFQ